MLTRIFIGLAIVAGLAVILLTQFTVRPHLQQIIDTRDLYGRQWTNETKRANNLQKELRATEEKLVTTETDLKDTQTRLASETTRANDQERRANGLQKDLTETRGKLSEAQQELAAWGALGLAVDQVKTLIESEKTLRQINEVLNEEKLVLTRVNSRLDRQLKELLGEKEMDPVLPEGTRGQVLVVDPKWRFVVLNIGEKEGMEPRGVLMVSRDGKLIAKVRITTVYEDRSIANVMTGWEFGEIMEGDLVLY